MLVLLQHLMGKPAALDYLGKLQANNVGPVVVDRQAAAQGQQRRAAGRQRRRADEPRLDQGRRLEVHRSSFPAAADGKKTTVSLPYVAGVTKGAPHADGAKKLLAFLVSEDVQKTVAPDALGIPVLSSLASSAQESADRTPRPAVLKGVDVWVPDWNAVLADLDADVAAYQKATGS